MANAIVKCEHCGKLLVIPRTLPDEEMDGPEMPPLRELSDQAAVDLSCAIVRQVVDEYRLHLKRLKKQPHYSASHKAILLLRDEIMSEYFGIIAMGIDPEALIREIEKSV